MHCYMPISEKEFRVGYFTPARAGTPESKRMEAQFITVGVAVDATAAARFVNYLNGGTGAPPTGDEQAKAAEIAVPEGPASGF